jgi:2-hydroxy-6-oxonona-2,4-dienedioate hydrolase
MKGNGMRKHSSRSIPVATGVLLAALLLVLMWVAMQVRERYMSDMAQAQALAAQGSVIAQTRCGPIEYQETGQGLPVLMAHGSGGGHDQGMAFARPLAQHGVRAIAMSRFGYLRTPRPANPSPEAQADAHICLLGALGIQKAAVMGASAGAPSAMQTAIRHPDRVSALVLLVPIAFKPSTVSNPVPPLPDWMDALLLRLLGSDVVFWTALQLAPDQVIRHVMATPPVQVETASVSERARVRAMADRILPVSARAAGLRDDTGMGKHLRPYALASIRVPTLVISARDDGFGTYANAEYIAGQIPGARFVGFDQGGHLWVGHDREVGAAILDLLKVSGQR